MIVLVYILRKFCSKMVPCFQS